MSSAAFYKMPHELYDRVRSALDLANLPNEDIDNPDIALFGLSDYRGVIGYVGMEGQGPDRLLRSLVILPDRRGEGFGRELIDRLEIRAVLEAKRLHLLTNDAAPFFRKLGYFDAERSAAPISITGTAQFRTLCPASAAYLTKELE